MSALGETFRAARESQGLSLADVADRIHIRSVYLAAIEAEDWQAIGPPVYVRGFVRSYARCLGLDPDAALASFGVDPSAGPAAPSVVLAPSPRGEPSRSGLPRGEVQKRGPSVWAVLGLVVASALVLFVGYEYFEYRYGGSLAGHPASPRASGAPAPMTRRRTASVETAARAVAPELHPAAKNAVKSNEIALRIKDESWLRVIVDGKVEMEGLFATGTSRTFAGRSVTIRVGNAGGVDLSVGGKDLGPMGGLGDVAERSFQL
jgi:cytoskeletal protein RodZ